MPSAAFSRNLVITSSGDGSTTGPNGAVDVETVFVNATGVAPSTFNVGDLSRTTVSTLAIRPAAAGVAGFDALISGSALDDEIALGDSTVLGAIDPTVSFANYDIVLPDGIGTLSVNGRAGNDRIRVNAISGDGRCDRAELAARETTCWTPRAPPGPQPLMAATTTTR